MSEVAIRAIDLSKEYYIGAKHNDFRTLRDSLVDTFASPFRRAAKLLRGQATKAMGLEEKIWALRDVSFEVKCGEAVGIIGRNGAGKSTLLRILSRISEPTCGYAEIHGRVASLLEVGTGFHPELTGRENVYLNGAILGMRKEEIRRKFDEMVAFAEIERFIDTPVKHYSSGMYVRLAFAVAAHLDPEILIVDEVLAVGDAPFQKKCLSKMTEFGRGGRTVLFVSHNLMAAANLCRRGIVLNEGKLMLSGDMKDAVDYYLHSISGDGQGSRSHITDLSTAPGRPPTYRPLLKRLELFSGNGEPLRGGLPMGAALKAHICFQLEHATSNFNLGLGFNNLLGQRIFTAHSIFEPQRAWNERVGEQVFVCEIPSLTLVPGEYRIKVSLDTDNTEVDFVEDAARLAVVASDYYGTGRSPWNGTFVLEHHWNLCRREEG
jgi:lipopolysaccharide transport system ATP-binding protein